MDKEPKEIETIETEHGAFTENILTGKTAEEVYKEWLENKDKEPSKTKICTMEDLQEENEDLKKKYEQLLDTTQFLLKNTGFIPKEVNNG